MNNSVPGRTLFIGFQGDNPLYILWVSCNITDRDQADFIQTRYAVSTGEFGRLCRRTHQSGRKQQ
ncbi:hypothetical protein LTSEALA_6099 [Salmonella enterica subsp. enterica serovar Alachua str. R6-377]|uniref:Uncharacterized protein n=1 Tax=Salmonella enterica subsp. enterica serovar Alachua str. R6-377 TaxID=913241 RepID=G5LXD5_SALET|nr:hypothetical protein LTSEALA_6099 [Salmonella enterica subsp. enterica serovar Alachua str. R6-377]